MPRIPQRALTHAAIYVGLLVAGCASNRMLPLKPAPDTPVDLSGQWQLDPSRSQDPSTAGNTSAGGVGGGHHGHGGHGGGGMGGGGFGGGGGGGMAGGGGMGGGGGGQHGHGGGGPDGSTRQLAWPVSMTISQDATTLHMVNDGVHRDLPLVSQPAKDAHGIATGWYDSEFVVESGGDGRMQVTQRYSLSPDRHQLSVRTEIGSKQRSEPVTVWRVFNRVTPDAH
ncbi:hypothetical protein KPL74_17340 [Bacillus sp. NP157]|nr:hypothetical protein KPL74_17340 [Bacillus sp. NP157]